MRLKLVVTREAPEHIVAVVTSEHDGEVTDIRIDSRTHPQAGPELHTIIKCITALMERGDYDLVETEISAGDKPLN